MRHDAQRLDDLHVVAAGVQGQARALRLARMHMIAGLRQAHDDLARLPLARRELADALEAIDAAELRLIGRVFGDIMVRPR